MTIDEAEDVLIEAGLPEPVAMDVLEVLGHFGVYEVRVKPLADHELYYAVRCIMQNEYEVHEL